MNKETQRRLEAQYQQSLEDGCVLTEPSEWKYVRMPASKRRALFPELYSHYDPDQIMAQEDPPADCLAHFKEVFGDFANPKLFDPTRVGWVKLKMHPHFRRWTIFEWAVDPRTMKYSWRPLYIACHEVEPGELPPDLKTTDGRYDNLKGSVGAYKVPTREDFWMVRYIGDRSLNTAESTCFKVMEDDDRAEKERERIRADKMRDRLDYMFNLYARDVNREDGAMQGFHVVPQESLDVVHERKLERVYNKEVVKDAEGTPLYTRLSRKKRLDDIPVTRFYDETGRIVNIKGAIASESVIPTVTMEQALAKYLPANLDGEGKAAHKDSTEHALLKVGLFK